MARRKNLTAAPDELTTDQKLRIAAWITERYPRFANRHKTRAMWEACRDWHLANGVERADWEATFRSWVRKQSDIDSNNNGPHLRRPKVGSRELPQEEGERSGGIEPLRLVLGGLNE